LDQPGKHNSQAKVVADVCKVDITIPADHTDIIENSKAGNTSHKAKGAINSLKDQLRGSVLNHTDTPLYKIA
jgi:hypothetical protein